MTAADCLVTKAGPGSIAEAMIKGLPCLLTAFVPGQEEGNITYVTDNGAGAFVPDEEPEKVADKVAEWLSDPELMLKMSTAAQRLGRPDAALDITRRMCDTLLDLGIELEEVGASAPGELAEGGKAEAAKGGGSDGGGYPVQQPPRPGPGPEPSAGVVDDELLQSLQSLGFSRQDAEAAAKRSPTVEAAVEWLEAHES
ncbi:unnamed protein product [Polarella glacialis]|uniref:UBA domain-containing protein n=1 Tax=Polarella glacialis TaxID=89957 RepID=A0A813KEE9_POLGL|nr:unnamed protein product [Polarella glacialis]